MDLIADLDAAVVRIAAHLAQRSEGIDRLVMHIHGVDLLKAAVLLALLAWVWFAKSPEQPARRLDVLRTVLAGMAAAAISRGVQNLLPPRARPMNAGADFVAPYGLTPEMMEQMRSWGSFPSDHAALSFALATGIWLLSRRLGIFALLWALLVICLPRLYLGLHYASDIVGGAALGGTVLLTMRLVPGRLLEPVCRIERHSPGPFYAAAFLFSYELARLFWDVRALARQLLESARLLAGP